MLRNAVVFFLSIIAISASLSAQALECTLTVDSAVSSYIKEWTEADAVRLHVRNTKDVPLHFVIETTVALDGHALVTTAHGKRVHLQMLPGEVRVFHCDELLPLRSAYFTDRTRMDRTTGRITVKGDLRICVAVLDTLTVRSYAKPMCIKRTVVPYTEAECESPVLQSVLPAKTPVRISWKSVVPVPRHAEYRVRIYACDSSQYLAQAVRTNEAVLDTVIVNATAFAWSPPARPTDTRYAWQVYASDGKGTEYGMSTGYSIPSEFTVRGVHTAQRKAPRRNSKR